MTILKLIRCLQYSLAMTSIATLGVTQLAAEVGNPRVNQVGYLPNGPKIATLNASTNTANHWELRQHNTVITSGTTTPRGFDVASGNTVHQINFSQITQEGNNFTLHVGADQSYPFSINKNILTGALYDSLRYFYHNRSGIAIETPYTGGGRSSYGPNARWSRPAGHLNTSPNTGDSNVACWPGTCNYSLNVTKGWYDAGDHGKYVVNGGISVWKLLNMYERALHLSDNAKDFADNTLNIPVSGNGVADILDEARWEIEFLLSMQVPANQPLAGMAHHKMHDQGWTGLPLAPH
ncbi:MAG: glycoside hydrolase family 9 protein, partial [Spongiibacteraceae bacterium]|nr:glycoside hydrolase family 9 protein [Spongiibacteraceae bacterium]